MRMSSCRTPGNSAVRTYSVAVSCRSMGGTHPDGPGLKRSSRCWMARRSRIGSHRANATETMVTTPDTQCQMLNAQCEMLDAGCPGPEEMLNAECPRRNVLGEPGRNDW